MEGNGGEAEYGIKERQRSYIPESQIDQEKSILAPTMRELFQYHSSTTTLRSSSEQWSSAGKIKMDLTGGTFRNDRPNKIARTGPISLRISVESGTGTT